MEYEQEPRNSLEAGYYPYEGGGRPVIEPPQTFRRASESPSLETTTQESDEN